MNVAKPLVIIPTYNELENLEQLVRSVRSTSPTTTILIVDDNSPDGTGRLADTLAQSDRQIQVLHRPKKAGLGRAYQAGFTWGLAGHYDPICTMDADFSHDPHDLTNLIATITNREQDIAIGSRYVRGGKIIGWTWDRHLLSGVANWLAKICLGLKPKDITAGYKCYRRSLLQSIELETLISPGYAFHIEMLARGQRVGGRITEIPITFRDRTVGRSKVSRHELINSMRSLLTLTSRRPGLRELVKFSLVGSTNLVIDLGLTNLGVLVFGWSAVWAGYLGVSLALMNSFILNRSWTFRAKHSHLWQQVVRFFLVNGSGAAINAGLYTLFLLHFGWPYNLAKIVAIGGSVVWNFLGTKFWVFRARPPALTTKVKT